MSQSAFDALMAMQGTAPVWASLGEAHTSIATVWRQMEELSQETQSSSLEGARFYLQIHRRHKETELGTVVTSMDVRWRMRRNRDALGHIPWSQVEALMQGLPLSTQRYYRRVNERVQDLQFMSSAMRDLVLQMLRRVAGTRMDIRVSTRFWVLWLNGELTPSNIVQHMKQP